MSRKMLITLIFLMVFVLSGLILVQTKMIKTASDIREEQFNQLVRSALLRVAAQLDQYELIVARNSAMTNQLSGSTLSSDKFNVFPKNSISGGSISFGLRYSENGVVSSYQEEIQFNLQDTSKTQQGVTKMQNENFFGFESLVEFTKEQQRKRESYLNDMNWYRNYKVFLEERPIQERIDSVF
jgi:two-component system, OmpR family, phosphate regulon sensor histidine kinase PhoR